MKNIRWGAIAFSVGIFGSIILGLLSGFEVFTAGIILTTVLVLSGIVIGLINISAKESIAVMISALVLGVGAASLYTLPIFGQVIDAVLASMSTVILPAGVVIAIKTIIVKAK